MSSSGASVDVLVIGLGPAGGAAAAAAARRGSNVLAIDRKRVIGVPVQCAEYIPLPLLRYARGDEVTMQGIDTLRTVLPSLAEHTSPFPGLMIDRARFDQHIAQLAQDSGAQLRLGTSLVGLDAARSIATVRSREGEYRIGYRVLIAADGPASRVARLMGLAGLDVIPTRQYTVPIARASNVTEVFLSGDYPGGYAWLFPKRRSANLGVGFECLGAGACKAALDRLHGRLVSEDRVGAEVSAVTGGAIPVGGLRGRLAAGNTLFAGDAGGFTHPITGAGIAAAVQSGDYAGSAAARYAGGMDIGALDDYEDEMRDLFGDALNRAVARRRELLANCTASYPRDDTIHRRGWIAFSEYYA